MGETKPASTTFAVRPAVVMEDDSPSGIAHARDVARAFADSLVPPPAADRGEIVAVVVSELVTNALRHGGGRYRMLLSADADAVHVAVGDLSPEPPRERAPDYTGGTGGFGWHMVRCLTESVTVIPGPEPGKTVHAVIPR
ncbi:Anti-sigma regulatory factor (Ser/Thr protein kinase) [Actinacidiphila alni]|uniref:Anti-sigma regulatory factor (Ser/Thr protein kinase) n=1 Tax=Actinacidiphila alni TaxID=380248 RepID=A0A1I2MIL6_9ACTN|nr:ATP-binding protein [Actinacidiphila alni]SFF91344.1 Anti-sigma regulatory factor (Ser/Thr protein kinase) [Actinacidiphila alni]